MQVKKSLMNETSQPLRIDVAAVGPLDLHVEDVAGTQDEQDDAVEPDDTVQQDTALEHDDDSSEPAGAEGGSDEEESRHQQQIQALQEQNRVIYNFKQYIFYCNIFYWKKSFKAEHKPFK